MVKIFSICVNLKWRSKYPSIQLNQRQQFTAVLKSIKNFTEKNLCMGLFLKKVAGLHPKKRFLCRCFPVSFTKRFRGPFLQNTNGWLLLQNILLFFRSTSARKCYHWSCFFLFTLNIFRANPSLIILI